ncbi:4-hydroxybenzoate polyprenyltransferase [Conyzicola lurida]|uniref:4-hydroxybenzoate polyprenyltransferase n=1 Tax=Conyzicola lurida TaxID=1172621 RepID=A0A841AJS0_9MICO|nr:UbiA family prenyltransferase [Conyzicola lurida]MBB5843457.1 4-hydroxybenzoate polyprenyltransferase [Conyzicola lurida]
MSRSPVVALALSTHPGPTVLVSAVTALLAIGAGLDPARAALVTAAVFVGQVSVGLSNDWLDAARDAAVGRTDKPVARGQIGVGTVRAVSLVTAVLAVVMTIPLGWAATTAHLVFVASAWSYNFWLKRTPFSVLPFVVSFGLLPAVVTLSATPPQWASGWTLGAGALLGVAAHFANVLPDLDDDRVTGIAGLPHRLGRRASGAVIAVVLAAASGLVLVGSGEPGPLQWAGCAATVLIAAVCGYLAVTRPPTRLLFQLIMLAALLNVTLLAFSPRG